jgi:hypothetical protein
MYAIPSRGQQDKWRVYRRRDLLALSFGRYILEENSGSIVLPAGKAMLPLFSSRIEYEHKKRVTDGA